MWVLILTLVLSQQEMGTKAEVSRDRIENIASEALCEEGKRRFLESHKHVATEPTTDYEAPEDEPEKTQPKDDQWKLVRPVAVCIQTR